MILSDLLNPGGGLRYHFRALSYRNSLWLNFKANLSEYFDKLSMTSKKLLIIGPSGGYCIPDTFLQRFESITCIDIDPFAQTFFQRVHSLKNIDVKWSRENFVRSVLADSVLKRFSDHVHFYSNFLGQIEDCMKYEGFKDAQKEEFRKQLKTQLLNSTWVSVHDRLSTTLRPKDQAHYALDRVSSSKLVDEFFTGRGTVNEHDIEFLDDIPARNFAYFPWFLTPRQNHIIECMTHL